jgi:hypothetical protein
MHSVFYGKSGVTGTEPELRPSASKTTASWIRRTTVSAADAVTRCCPLGPHTAEQRAGEPDLCASQSFATRPFMEAFLVLVVLGENGFGVVRLGKCEIRGRCSDGGLPPPRLGRWLPARAPRRLDRQSADLQRLGHRGLGGSDLSPAARLPSARCGLGSTAQRPEARGAATGGAPA